MSLQPKSSSMVLRIMKLKNSNCFPIVVLSLVVLALHLSALAQTTVTKEGVPIRVTVEPEKRTIMMSEPIYFKYIIENYSEQKVCFRWGGDYRNRLGRPESFDVRANREDGLEAEREIIEMSFGGLVGCNNAPANGKTETELFLPNWVIFKEPGSYTVTVRRWLTTPGKSFFKPKSSIPTESTFQLIVEPDDDEKIGKLISDLGVEMLTGKPSDKMTFRAAFKLSRMKDARSAPYFIKLLDSYSDSDSDSKIKLARAAAISIGPFPGDEVLEALERASKSDSQDVRLRVADALKLNKHTRSMKVLIGMKNDEYEWVRLRVAQGLSLDKSEEGLLVLKELAKDPESLVSDAAKMVLANRTKKANAKSKD